MSVAEAGLRIGEVARRVGTTPRTIRYYEEIGILPAGIDRAAGQHRLYTEADVERLRDALRLKDLLGVSLEELKALVEAEEARAALRDEWRSGEPSAARSREILDQALGHLERQLALVRHRREEIDALEHELAARRERVLELRENLVSSSGPRELGPENLVSSSGPRKLGPPDDVS